MAQELKEIPVTIQYGHDGERVIMQFSQSLKVNHMTIAQAEAMIVQLHEAIDLLKKHTMKTSS